MVMIALLSLLLPLLSAWVQVRFFLFFVEKEELIKRQVYLIVLWGALGAVGLSVVIQSFVLEITSKRFSDSATRLFLMGRLWARLLRR